VKEKNIDIYLKY